MATAAELIASADILAYISQYTNFVYRNGEYWALSPLTNEVTPSFSVNTDKRCYYDFSSGSNGNIISFIKAYHRCDTHTAFEILKAYLGVSDDDDEEAAPVQTLEATKVAMLFKARPTMNKLSTAVILDDQYMDRYDTDPKWLAPWRQEGISDVSMKRFNVAYDQFSNRIVFPIKDMDGNIINISGRAMDPLWKEKGQRKYTYFKSAGTIDTIFGFSENKQSILEKGEIILFEGAKSVLKADTWGITNTGAILTSHLNEGQLRKLIKLGVSVVFALDKEVEPWNDRNIRRLTRFVPVKYIYDRYDWLQEKMSPVDMGFDIFCALYERRVSLRNVY